MPVRRRALLLGCLFLTVSAVWGDGQTVVTLTARDRTIRSVITDLAAAARVTVKIRPEVNGLVSATITRLPFEEALTVICTSRDYAWRLENGVYLVGQFAATAAGEAPAQRRVELPGVDPRPLARAFGWLDRQSLDEPGAVQDLRGLLPPGLSGPPRPVAGGLEVAGTATAVADFAFLVRNLLQGNALLTSQVLVAELDPDRIADLPVYWNQGVMRQGASPGREVEYNAGNLAALETLLRRGGEGLRLLADGTVTQPSLATARFDRPEAARPIALRLALRTDAGLGLSVWLHATIGGDPPVELTLDGAALPPDEDCVILSRAPDGAATPALLVLLRPTVTLIELPEE